MDYKSRWYDSYLNQWTQPDTLIPQPDDPQSLNRFSYVRDNPINRIDPTGHTDSWWCTTASCNSQYAPDANGVIGGHAKKQGDDSITGAPSLCTGSNILHGKGCNPQYYSIALGPDVPTILMGTGLVTSLFAPEVGIPIGLTGAILEACAPFDPVCTVAKLTSVNGDLTVDTSGDVYLGVQASFGKSILPFGSFSIDAGTIATNDGHIPQQGELQKDLEGFSVSGETIFNGGMAISPKAPDKVSYYTPSYTDVFSLNAQYNILLYSP